MKIYIIPSVLLLSAVALVSFSNDIESIHAIDDSNMTLLSQSNAAENINRLEFTGKKNTADTTFQSSSPESIGFILDSVNDAPIESSTAKSNVLVFEKIDPTLNSSAHAASTTPNIEVKNARDIAVYGDKIVVSSEAVSPRDSNKLYVYETSAHSLSLTKVFETDYKHWGIFISGNTLYASMDNTNSIAVYTNIFDKADGVLVADDVFVVEGAKSLRGVTYDEFEDILFLTDVGNPLNDGDDAIHTINNFSFKYSGMGTHRVLAAADMTTTTGFKSMLGNPVDLEYKNIGKVLYAAEHNNQAGFIPNMKKSSSGTSDIHLNVE